MLYLLVAAFSCLAPALYAMKADNAPEAIFRKNNIQRSLTIKIVRAYVDDINSRADAAEEKGIKYALTKDECFALAADVALEVNPPMLSIMNACANIKYLELLTDNKEQKKLCQDEMKNLLIGRNQLRNAVEIIDMGSYSEDIRDADNGLDMLGILAEVYPDVKFADLPWSDSTPAHVRENPLKALEDQKKAIAEGRGGEALEKRHANKQKLQDQKKARQESADVNAAAKLSSDAGEKSRKTGSLETPGKTDSADSTKQPAGISSTSRRTVLWVIGGLAVASIVAVAAYFGINHFGSKKPVRA